MLVARIALSDSGRASARAAHMENHKEHLRSGLIKILKSGPFKQGDIRGALILANVDSLDEMRTFSRLDPFVIHGVYKLVHIVEWDVTLSTSGASPV